MKTFFLSAFLLFLGLQSYAQLDPEKMLYAQKVEKYHRMKNNGKTLVVAGSILVVVGAVTLLSSSATTTYQNGYTTTTTEGNPLAGAAAYLIGYGYVGAGVPLWVVGGVNEGRYQRKLDAITVGANINQHGGGVTVQFKF